MTRDEMTKALAYYNAINPRFAPDFSKPPVVSFWFDALGKYPVPAFKAAMDRLIKEDRFPTIKDVELALGSAVNPEDDAIVIAGRIVSAISRFGAWGPEDAKAMIGSVGWEVVRLSGGWSTVCEVSLSDLGMKQAQWRELARSMLERGGRSLPELPPPMTDRGLKLIQGLMEDPGKGKDTKSI